MMKIHLSRFLKFHVKLTYRFFLIFISLDNWSIGELSDSNNASKEVMETNNMKRTDVVEEKCIGVRTNSCTQAALKYAH